MAQAPPVLDFSAFYSNDPELVTELVNDVRKCCVHNGFFQIVGHRVPTTLQEEVIECVKSFFSLPQAQKEKVHKDNTTWNRGYEPLRTQILEPGTNPDIKEGYYIGEEISTDHPYFTHKKLNSGPNQWPDYPHAERFGNVSMTYYNHMHALARDVLSVLAQTLDLDADYFGGFTKDAVATLRYLHYPPQPADPMSRGIGAHTDFGAVTLLMQDEVDGLQVWEKKTESWIDVVPVKGAYVVNLGNVFMRWTNDRYISNLHRVINKSGKERYSVPFFYSGNPDYEIACLPNCRENGAPSKYPPITVMDCVGKSYRESYGRAQLFNQKLKEGENLADVSPGVAIFAT